MEREPEALKIVWEPPPESFRKYKGWRWEKLLAPIKAAPGSPGRIWTSAKKSSGQSVRDRARKRLKQVAPLEDWHFSVRKIQDDSGTWGVWATYNGMMTPAERARREMESRAHGDKIRKTRAAKKLREQLQAGAVDDITRPRPGRR